MRPIWETAAECTRGLLSSARDDNLPSISEIEDGLDIQTLFSSVAERLNAKRDS
jgi:hypothetical protein